MKLVVSRQDKVKAKEIICVVIAKLKHHSMYFEPKQSGVKIPFERAIMDSIANDKVWSMTVADRTMKYLSIITKVHMDGRPRLVHEETGKFYPISTFEDLKETLIMMERGASGVRPYVANWYNQVFLPCFSDLDGKPIEDISDNGYPLLREKYVGVTTEQAIRED